MRETGDRLARILSDDRERLIFLHNTRTKETAREISREGFRFESQLTYSTDRVSASDPVEISYFLVERKDYGNYTIIIEIDRKLFLRYSKLAEAANLHFEDILTINKPGISDDDEFIYTLSAHYIKGFFNNKTGEMTDNPLFDPTFDSPVYLDNFERLRGE